MADCLHMADFAGEACPGCGEEIDQYGNTANDFNSCSFPDCGCDGARLCMAGSASDRALQYNGEGMYHSADPTARMAFIGAFYEGKFAQGIEARQGQDAKRLDAKRESPVAESDAP